MNKCLFSGRLTKDPVYKERQGEKRASLYFSFALDSTYRAKKQAEEKGTEVPTVYFTCWLYGEEATKMKDKLYKGVKVLIDGEFSSYTRPDMTLGFSLMLSSCEIMSHTKAYIAAHGSELKKEEAADKKRVIGHAKEAVEEKSTAGWWNNRGKDYEDDDTDDYLCAKNSTNYTRNKRTGILEDNDGFMLIDEDECELPFN